MTLYKLYKDGTWFPMQDKVEKPNFSVTSDGVWVLEDEEWGDEFMVVDDGGLPPNKLFKNVFISE